MRFLAKLVTVLISVVVANFLFSSRVFALATFATDYVITYDINEQGQTHVIFNIAQKNNLSTVYATSFSLSLSQTNLKNIQVRDAAGLINPQISQTENITNINFDFANKVVGKDKVNQFSIQYDSADIANRQGSVWEINIPKLEPNENTNSQQIILRVPAKFGTPAYIDPKPSRIDGNNYLFTSAALGNKSISAVFGTTQFFKVQLTYNLNNPLSKNLDTQIALPPDTNYQSVFINSIKPKPNDIAIDPDGNWLASYSIAPNTDLQIAVEMVIKLSFNPFPVALENQEIYTRSTKLWNTEDSDVAAKAAGLTTPKAIYDFVTNYLTYSYSRIANPQSDINRPGAVWALANPTKAICTEFTDLFIALARKNNIPARELQGYALSSNDKLKPLSLAKDILHAWPEYYDRNKQTWIQIDPTWGNTTGGIDYFNKLDLNHLVFAIHGIDSTQPLPAGAYKTQGGGSKDVFVKVVEPLAFPSPSFQISYRLIDNNHLFLDLKNLSGISGDAQVKILESKEVKAGGGSYHLAPYSSSAVETDIKLSPHLYPITAPLIITINGQETTLSITYQPNLPLSVVWATALLGTVGLALIARSLYLRRRRKHPPVHW